MTKRGDAGSSGCSFNERRGRSTTGERFKAESPGAGVEVEHDRPIQDAHMIQARKESFAHSLGRGARARLGHGEGPAFGATCDDSGHASTLPACT